MAHLGFSFGKPSKPSVKATDEGPQSPLNSRISHIVAKATPQPKLVAKTIETRKGARFVPANRETVLTFRNGERVAAQIVNVSREGVRIKADFSRVMPYDVTTIGMTSATFARRTEGGAAFAFAKPLSPRACNAMLIL